ncbi:hypothetical protein ESA94_08210 [Lacibacter luteus]|uniref:Uncharacterized protein n=1 Tax=Lacibacter luteus TaxID=2508719 RepID=A0A4Q1CJG0_9BACT|nr:hypothetical protein [Lacibacter luteus]RXK60442.1 hypothetical protein ESA94_08210 [Lacibacter luteus]
MTYIEGKDSLVQLVNGMPPAGILEGGKLSVQLITTGCFVPDDEPLVVVSRINNEYLASVSRNGSVVLSEKRLDSSFTIEVKKLIGNCNRILNSKKKLPDSSRIKLEFANHHKIVISDGLRIIGVPLDKSMPTDPFREFVAAIYWHGQKKPW